jgi:molybdenum cofactor cytidylyltransferase
LNTSDSKSDCSINDKHIGIIILSAGVSSRLGRPKQLLKHVESGSLIRHTCQVAINSGFGPIVLVVGARKELILEEVRDLAVHTVDNLMWSQGISGSIKTGLDCILELDPSLKAVIILVCDQPFLTSEIIKKLVSAYNLSGKPIIASTYKDVLGTPALFDRSFFSAILELTGDTGASKIIYRHPDQVEAVIFEQGGVDIDTEEDYERYMK